MTNNWWIYKGCGPTQFCRQRTPYPKERKTLVSQLYKDKKNYHRYGPKEFDPLISNLVTKMNEITGIRTITSCQGYSDRKPYVYFQTTPKALLHLAKICTKNQSYWWYVPVITYVHDNRYFIQFYDIIAAMQLATEEFKL